MPADATAIEPSRGLLKRYRDFLTRNWPVWWSLRLGIPIVMAIAMALATVGYASFVETKQIRSVHQELIANGLTWSNWYSGSRRQQLKAGKTPEQAAKLDNAVNDSLARVKKIRHISAVLTGLPLFLAVLGVYCWYFIVARSMKFAYAPQLGQQPRISVLILAGIFVVCAALIGHRIFEMRAFGAGFWDTSSLGDVGGEHSRRHSYASMIGDQTLALMIATSFIFAGAIFALLQRHLSLAAAFGGLIVTGLGLAVWIMFGIIGGLNASHQVPVVGGAIWAVLMVACLLVVICRRNLNYSSTVALSTMLYLVSVGPVVFLIYQGSNHVYQNAFFAFITHNYVGGYLAIVATSLIACELIFMTVNRLRLRPN